VSERSKQEIWCIDLTDARAALLALEARVPRLSVEEHRRAEALSDASTREEWLAAHIALRLLIERTCGNQWRQVAFTHDDRGKPRLEGAPVEFSLSHARGLALIALSRGGIVGVDVERTRTVRIDPARRHRICEAGAAMSAAILPAAEDERFLQAWVRLEALAKAEGCGIGRMLTRLGILGAGARAPAKSSATRATAEAVLDQSPASSVRDLALGEGVFGAVASPHLNIEPQPIWLPTGFEQLEKLTD
jgi:4'-phosphopantetheinyl transferase